TGVVTQQPVQLLAERGIRLRSVKCVGQFVERGDERLWDEAAAVRPEMAGGIGRDCMGGHEGLRSDGKLDGRRVRHPRHRPPSTGVVRMAATLQRSQMQIDMLASPRPTRLWRRWL